MQLCVSLLQWDNETWPERYSWTYWKWKIFVSIVLMCKKNIFKQLYVSSYELLLLLLFLRFLDILAARKDPSGLSGEVLIDGAPQPPNFKCLSGYVVQVNIRYFT